MQFAKKMILMPEDTLAKLQRSKTVEQTPTTRVLHDLDDEMKRVLDRSDISADDKVKLYHQTLHRYAEFNRQRNAPLTLTLQRETPEKSHSPHAETESVKASTDASVPSPKKEDITDAEGPKPRQVFAKATHLPLLSEDDPETTKKKRKRRTAPKRTVVTRSRQWTPY